MRLYGTIEKAEPQEDGTIIVTGYASSEDVDSQGEIVTAEAMKAALPDYMKFANIREMHQMKAAGVALEAEVQDDGRTWLRAHIVDDDAVKKVQKQVYKGFSIGGRVTGRDESNKAVITGLQLSEISLVDRPANSQAVFSMGKVDLEPEITLSKGMYLVAQLATILDNLNCLRQSSEWEEMMEGDDSAVPAELKEVVGNLSGVLRNMVAEETEELTAADETNNVILAASIDDVVKAGARNSNADLEKIQSVHDNAVALGATCSAEKAEPSINLRKMARLEDRLTKLASENSSLKKRVDELEALPKPPKAILKAVGKNEDTPVVPKQEEEPKDTLSAIKKVHSMGGKPIVY